MTPPADTGSSLGRRFILRAADPETGCPVLEAKFIVTDLSMLRAALAGEADDDPDLEYLYDLDRDVLAAIIATFGVAFDPGDRPTTLHSWHPIREVPYLVHTEFELALMLEGRKPLAVFSDAYPSEWFDDYVSRFDPFVAAGRFVRRVVTRPFPKAHHMPDGRIFEGIREVYVAAPGEEWRIDAFMLLRDVGAKSGWNAALERYEGSLLGYEDWQNDWWIQSGRWAGARRSHT